MQDKKATGNKLPSIIANMTSIEEVHEYYQKIIRCMPNNVYWLDKNCITQGCNDNVLKFVGIEHLDDFIGINYETMAEIAGWTEGHGEFYKRDDLEVISSGTPKLDIEDPPLHDHKGNPTYYLSSRVPLFDAKNEEIIGVIGISIDITKRKVLENDLKQAIAATKKANQAKSEFIANMSHDLRTPLSGIVGLSEILHEKLQACETKELAHLINESGEQLLGLLNGILDMAKAENLSEHDLNETTFDLHNCLNGIIQLERPSTELKGIDMEVLIADDVPQFVITDRTKFHRILLNMLGNAIKFTEKGKVGIEVKLVSEFNNQVNLQFSIIDTGIGIPETEQDKIFERFFRVEPSYKGVYAGHGVGLNIAQNYAQLLGGEIKLESTPGVGTTFYLNIPVKRGADNHITASNTAIAKIKESKSDKVPFILLIEDNPVALKLVENYAQKVGCQFLSAKSGEEAIRLILSNDFDLILSDIGLPAMSGLEFTSWLRNWEASENKPSLPIVGLTAHARELALDECLQAGMNDVYAKPINANVMISILSQYLSKHFQEETSHEVREDNQAYEKFNLNLSSDDHELLNLNHFPILDMEIALANIGSEALLRDALELMSADEMNSDIQAIKQAYIGKNWAIVNKLMHKIKGTAVYCGLQRMKYACQFLERYQQSGAVDLLEPLYLQLIHVVKETQNFIGGWLKTNAD